MACLPFLPFLLLLSIFLPCHCNQAALRRHSVTISSLLPSTECSSISTGSANNSMLKIFHQHSPCSPLAANRSPTPSHRQLLHHDRSRATSIQNKISTSTASDVTLPSRYGLSLGMMDYVVTVGFGTPSKSFPVIFDTGSDISWIQCEPCAFECFDQKEPLFDPSQSSTYSNISCSSPDCALIHNNCESSNCIYNVKYGDSSYSSGFFATETLTLTSSDILTDFKFGCGEMNHGSFGRVAGLIGLGHSKVSLASQAAEKYGEVFSYCLPPSTSSTGFLTFGPNTGNSNIKYAPMSVQPGAPFYFVELIGLSIGGKNLGINPTVFSRVGTIIDSGTVITWLPQSAYIALRDEFRRQMSNYPTAPSLLPLDTCYNFTGLNSVELPAVGLMFSGGMTLSVDTSGILYLSSAAQACLAFAGHIKEDDVSIIGNMQQRTYNVVYDVGKGRIGFGAGGCN